MNSRTATLILHAPKDQVFSYLANIDNLPKWATVFCRELKKENGKNRIVTPMGELFFEIESDDKTGVIDMFAGPTEKMMSIFPVRVLQMPDNSSVILFTMFQTHGISDEQFESQYQSLLKEFENVQKEFILRCS